MSNHDFNAIAASWLAGSLAETHKDLTPEQRRVVGMIVSGSPTEEHMRAAGAEFVRGLKASRLFQRRHCFEGMLDKAQDGSYTIPWIMSDELPDRAGDVIRALGWDLANFKKNPVLLTAHNADLDPIGRVNNPRVERLSGRLALVGDVEFAVRESEDAAKRFRLAQSGFLKAGSVGFLPKEVQNPSGEKERADLGLASKYGVYFEKQELLEFSIVPLPMNPSALQMGVKEGRISSADADYAVAISGATERDWEKVLRSRARSFVSMAAVGGQRPSEPAKAQVQSIELPADKFSREQAAKWARDHGLGEREPEQDGSTWRFKLAEPTGEPKTVQLEGGIQALVARDETNGSPGGVWVVNDATAMRGLTEATNRALENVAESQHALADAMRMHAQAITDLGGQLGTSLRAERERVTSAISSDAEKQGLLEVLSSLDNVKATVGAAFGGKGK